MTDAAMLKARDEAHGMKVLSTSLCNEGLSHCSRALSNTMLKVWSLPCARRNCVCTHMKATTLHMYPLGIKAC